MKTFFSRLLLAALFVSALCATPMTYAGSNTVYATRPSVVGPVPAYTLTYTELTNLIVRLSHNETPTNETFAMDWPGVTNVVVALQPDAVLKSTTYDASLDQTLLTVTNSFGGIGSVFTLDWLGADDWKTHIRSPKGAVFNTPSASFSGSLSATTFLGVPVVTSLDSTAPDGSLVVYSSEGIQTLYVRLLGVWVVVSSNGGG